MAFNQLVKKSFVPSGATQAFIAPWTAYTGSKIALSGVTAGSVASTAGLVLAMGSTAVNAEWGSLSANVQTGLTTNSITATMVWQGSNDGTNWVTVNRMTNTANSNFAPAGTGGLITTTFVQAFQGMNPGYPYMRLAALVGGATGAAGDNVVVSYNWRMRWTSA
jgi:hypothetical protein